MGPRQQRQRGTGSFHFKEGEVDRLLNIIDERLRSLGEIMNVNL